jgi:hypothetical protein
MIPESLGDVVEYREAIWPIGRSIMSTAKRAIGVGRDSDLSHTPPPLPAGIVKALRVFKAHFPELLKKHPDKWVACNGERVLYVGDSQEALFKKCRKSGIPDGEFVVLYTLPDAADFID